MLSVGSVVNYRDLVAVVVGDSRLACSDGTTVDCDMSECVLLSTRADVIKLFEEAILRCHPEA